ncbi:ATP-dependent helicase [Stackebrandtia soli]|uniref:ATP-dependent helicase n=1 Tax=Stackebrandtia soli TaxID=1892856 RepID=UPI0039E84992
MTAARYRFVARESVDPASAGLLLPDRHQREVIDHRTGPLLVTGGPGSGKTTTLVEAVAARVEEGSAPGSILVFGFGRRGASRLRRRIAARLDRTGDEVPVFSFAAYAFAILRLAAAARDAPPPILLPGPEQDVIIRRLLASDTIDWPESVRPALATSAFVAQLRDLLLRATERGVSAPRLAELGRRHDRPEWISAADFVTRYVDVLALSSVTGAASYDTAEIVRAAASELADQPDLITPPRFVFVDELHDIDPASVALLRLVSAGASITAFGDADSATFGFRGGDARIMRQFTDLFPHSDGNPADHIDLPVCHRSAKELVTAAHAVSQRLSGGAHRASDHAPRPESGDGDVVVLEVPSATQQGAHVAQWLRTAHLRDGVEWSRMAVIVKSATQLGPIERALRHAAIPIRSGSDDTPLSAQPLVTHLLTAIRCGLDPKSLDEETASALLQSPYGGGDALSERRLRQALRTQATADDTFRSSGELLVEALREPSLLVSIPDELWADPARRIAGLMECARDTVGTVEDVLWAVWDRSNLGETLARRAVSADSRAFGADAGLDAMMTLFDWAAKFTDRLPGAGCEVFVGHVLEQRLPADSVAEHARRGPAVELLTAHSAKGREWDLVVVAGVQEGVWPNLRPRGSLMGAEYLVETLTSGAADVVDPIKVLLDEERRLFYVAMTRARDRLLVTTVADDDEELPSRFAAELGVEPERRDTVTTPLTLSGLVARLRRVAIGPDGPERDDAIALLARLAADGVAAAHPDRWWGVAPLSDDGPIVDDGGTVNLSPSAIEKADRCGLRWLLEQHGGSEPPGIAQQLGTLVHAAAERAATAPDPRSAMEQVLADHIDTLPKEATWKVAQERERVFGMADQLAQWLDANPREFVAAERAFRVDVPVPDTTVTASLKGKVDRLELDLTGRLHVVDIKTGTAKPRKAEMERHLQLAAYQVAIQRGAFEALAPGAPPGGGELVYPELGSKAASTMTQPALPDAANPGWAEEKLAGVAKTMAGSTFLAIHSDKCRTCAVKQCCPISGKGKPVTG